MITVHEIHSAPAGELSSLRSRIESAYSSGVITDNNAQNHIWREFNRRCFFSGNQSLMLVPTYDGFRPVNLDIDRIVLIDGSGDIQLIDESGFVIPLTYSTSNGTFGSSSYMFSSTESSFDAKGTLRQGNGFVFGDIEELDGATEFTLAFWIKKELTSDDFRIGSVVNSSNNAVLFDWDATQVNIKIAGSGNIGTITRTGVNHRDWTHFAIVYNGAETSYNKTKLYINGDLITSSAGPDSLPTGVFSDFSIGAVRSNNQAPLLSDGKASDVRLFSKALSESEIDSIYNYENISSGLIGHWISDNNDTLDYSFNHNSAIKYNNPIFVNGGPLNDLPTFGHNSIRLLGDSPSPFVGSQNKILNGTETELTLAFWIKRSLTADPAAFSIFAIREATNNQTFLTWDFRDFIIWGARDGNAYFYSDLTADTSTGWNHLAITIDTSKATSERARCFLNGAFQSTASADDTISDGFLVLGLNHPSIPSNTDGEGDYADCRVYNRALSDSEIANIYGGELIENGLIHWIATDDQDIEDKISGITMISSGETFITNDGPFV